MAPFDILEKPTPNDIGGSANVCNSEALHVKSTMAPQSSVVPHEIYDGGFAQNRGVCIRIANGTAGQIGLIGEWANVFIQKMVQQGKEPFQIAWYLGDSTESLCLLASGVVDMALTYVPAAERQLLECGLASRRAYAFRDRFALVGPHCNPAGLCEKDSIETMFSKIAKCGDEDVECPPNPDIRPATRFLSRCDKSATNIKESQIFLSIGQLPWGHDYSRWYHQFIRFPREALRAAAALSEYTLIDFGAWLSAPDSVKAALRVFKVGSDAEEDVLLNPAHLIYRKVLKLDASSENEILSHSFFNWIVDPDEGMKVTLSYEKGGHILYSRPPTAALRI